MRTTTALFAGFMGGVTLMWAYQYSLTLPNESFNIPSSSTNASATPSATTTSSSEPSVSTSPSNTVKPSTKPTASPEPTSTTAPKPTPTKTASTSKTVTSSVISYRYGKVQLSVTQAGNKLTDVTTVVGTATDGRQASFPYLEQQAIASQGISFGNLSGATYTSEAFKQALSSAISKL